MSDLHPLNNNKIIIIIKVYENKRTPGNLGIKSNTPNPKPFSVMWKAQVGFFWEEQENVLGENWSDANQHLHQIFSLNPTLQPLGSGAGFGDILAMSHLSTDADAARGGARLRDLIFIHGQDEVGTILALGSLSFGTLGFREENQPSTHFGKDSCPFITSRQLSNTPRMETHKGSGLGCPSPPQNHLGIPPFQRCNPTAQPQSSYTSIFWSWDSGNGEKHSSQKTPPSLFTSLWSQLKKRRGSGKAIVSK